MKKFEVVAIKYDMVKKQRVEYVAGTFESIYNAMIFKDAYEASLQSKCTVRESNIDEENKTFTSKEIIASLNAKYLGYLHLSAGILDNDDYLEGVYDGRMRMIKEVIELLKVMED